MKRLPRSSRGRLFVTVVYNDMHTVARKRGFIAIMTVLALMVFSLSLSVATTYLSIGEAQSGFAVVQGARALHMAEGCAEDALLQSSRDENYTGGTYSYLGGACTVDVVKNGTVWTLTIIGTEATYERRLEVVIDRVPPVTLQSWLEQ